MKRWKKALSCVLALIMIVCLLPMAAFAADPEPFVFVAGTDVRAGGYWTVDNDANEEHSVLVKCKESDNWNVSYDPATATLTLQNAEFFNKWLPSSQERITEIICSDHQDLNLVLLGENSCTSDVAAIDVMYYYGDGDGADFPVSGGGSLDVHVTTPSSKPGSTYMGNPVGIYASNMTVTGGTSIAITVDDNPYGYNTGICCSLVVEDGSVTIDTGNAQTCFGIDCDGGSVAVGQHGSLTVITGDTTYACSIPLFVGGVTVSGGTVTAIAGNAPHLELSSVCLGLEDGIEVSGGTFTAIGMTGAFCSYNKEQSYLKLGEGVTVTVNEAPSAEGSAPWDGITSLFYEYEEEDAHPYKYVQITDGKQNEPLSDPALGLLGGLLGKAPSQVLGPFVDVTPMDYYYDAVNWAVENDITTGTGRLSFSPDEPCTRAQAVTFLWRAAGCPAPTSTATAFTDVEAGSYYEKAVAWAVENGVTKGTSDTTFSPYASCTRAQIVTFLYRTFGAPVDAVTSFTDVAADAYYAPAVAWAAANRVTGGTAPAVFSPDAVCTRAQIVTFLYRCRG